MRNLILGGVRKMINQVISARVEASARQGPFAHGQRRKPLLMR